MKRTPCLIILLAFLINSFGPVPMAQADDFRLPVPGVMVRLSPPLDPPILKGIKVHPDNPFRFEFILDKGDSELSNTQLKDESSKLIKYFLASLTIPEKDLWVNLSPYEKDRIIPNSFGLTEMGRDLLAEDYMLKQITASLIYPEDGVGKKFWKRIYEEAQKKFGTTNVPVNTFNKVWIVPEKAVVYENPKAGTAYVVESKLKVMLEQDYLALSKHVDVHNDTASIGSNIVREVVIPELTKEINEDKNFSHLRQVYNSLILATWYKKKIKDSILEQVYADKNKTAGVGYESSVIARGPKGDEAISKRTTNDVELIYQRYLRAFKKGVYNYIKEDIDPTTQETIPRKYFSGGADCTKLDFAMNTVSQMPAEALNATNEVLVRSLANPSDSTGNIFNKPSVPQVVRAPEPKAQSNGLSRNPQRENKPSLSSQVHQMRIHIQDTNSENEDNQSASRAEFLEYQKRQISQRFRILNENDHLFVKTNQIFNDAIKRLKARGDIQEGREYQLVLYDSNFVNAYYVPGSNYVFMSTGLLNELDLYLKQKGRQGVALDHIAAILNHEIEHSVQNFDSLGQSWSEKKGDSRKKEYGADTESLFSTDALGFNPNAIVDVMDFFIYAQANPTLSKKLERVLGAHPQSIDRKNRLESIIQDKNVLLINTGKPYQHISLSHEDHLIKRLAQIRTAGDLEGFSGDIHEIVSMLAVMKHTNFINDIGIRYGLDSNLRNILDDPNLPGILRQYIRNKYGAKFSEAQQDLLYQIHFGFIFNDSLERGRVQDTLFTARQSSIISGLINQLNTQELRDVYLTIVDNPPIFTSDLPTQIEKETKYEETYFQKVKQLFFMNLSLTNALMMERLDYRTVLPGIRDLMKSMHYFYERDLTSVNEFSNYWQGIMMIFRSYMTDKNSMKFTIDKVKDVFKDQPTVQGSFYKKLMLYLIRQNSVFNNLSLSDQMEFINSLFPDRSSLKNEILRAFWDENKSVINTSLSPQEAKGILVRLMESVDLSNGERDRKLFFDDTGTELLYIDTGGISAVEQKKSLYGEMAKELTETLKRTQSQGQNLQEIYDLLDHNVLLDYQDLMHLYGTLLEQSDAGTYLIIADKIKRFIERNGLTIKEGQYDETSIRAADYHDAFILAYFYKAQGTPFTFYQAVDSEHAYVLEANNKSPFREKEQSYKQYEKIPLFLEISDTKSDKKTMIRDGHGALSKGNTIYFGRAWTFRFNSVFAEVFRKTGFKPTVDNLIVLRDGFLNKIALHDWMSLFYEYAQLKEGEILQIIAHLKRSESSENNPVPIGSKENNPIALVNAFRSMQIGSGRMRDSVGEQRALAKGFQLWGNRRYSLTTMEDLERAINELDRYFPYDSRLKDIEREKILIVFISNITGLPYSTQSIKFRYKIDGTQENVTYEGYSLNPDAKDFIPSEDQAVRLLHGFEKLYPVLTNDRKLFFGKLLYRMFRNNNKLSSFQNIAAHMELIGVLFPFYSKAKDDFIFEALDEHDVSVSDYQNAVKLTTRFALQDDEADVNKTIWGLELLKEAMRGESRAERRRAVLWLITGDDKYKPSKIQNIESENNASAKELIDMFWFLTNSEREDFLSEVLKGKNGLFEVQYEGSDIQEKITKENTRKQVKDAIEKRFNASNNFGRLKLELSDLYMLGVREVLYGISNPRDAQRAESLGKALTEAFPFLGQGLVSDLNTRMEERNGILTNLRSEVIQIVNETMLPLFKELGINLINENGNFQNEILTKIIRSLENNEGSTEQDVKDKVLKALISAVTNKTTVNLSDALFIVQRQDSKELTPEKELVNRLMPVLQVLADKTTVRAVSLMQSSNQFVNTHANEEVSNAYYRQAQQTAEAQAEEVFSSLGSPNPLYLRLLRILQEYRITPGYESELKQFAEFEEFIDDLIDGQLKGIFEGETYQTLKGLIEVKFKYHSLDRRVQFLNGLLPALHGKKSKGDVIVALAEQSGIPVLKFLQILSQRKAFVELENDPSEGERLNERIGSVKSDADPIRKATIFQVLAQEGLLGIVKVLGKRLGSASIKQVHKLVLNEPIIVDGQEFSEVALKVKRPSALKHLDEDIHVLDRLVEYFNGRHPKLAVSRDTLDKVRTAINEELDFNREIEAQRTFLANMRKRGSKLNVPLVFNAKNPNSEKLVILEEFIEGTLLKDTDDDQDAHRSYRILDEFFKQVFVDGTYHADLHDGNIMVGADGKVTFIDLGGYGKVPQGKKKTLYRLIESIATGSSNKLITALKEFGVNVDPIMAERIELAFEESNSNEERFQNIFLILSDDRSGMPNSLFMFFQAISKVGKYFDNIGLRRFMLFAKYKLSVSISNETKGNNAQLAKKSKDGAKNGDLLRKGGIDLTPANMNVEVKTGSPTKAFGDDRDVGVGNDNGGIKFHLTPAMLQQLQNAPGFVPVIISIQPMTDLKKFLGINASV